jgi:membrane protease YdiL (CAAX protease family)
MDRFVLVAAVLPGFGLLLFLVSAPLARWGRSVTPARVAPPLYVGVLAAATVLAVLHTGGQPDQFGLVAPELAGLPVALAAAAMLLAGLAGALVTYLGELWLVSRLRTRRRGGPGVAGTPAGTPAGDGSAMRAVRSWLPNPGWFLAVGVLTAVLEELLWRGYLLTGLRDAIWLLPAVALQAALFGLNHLPFGGRHMLAKAGSGLVWGLLVVGFGSVLVGLVAHLGFQVLAARRLWRQSRRVAGAVVSQGGEERAVHHAESA